MQGQIRNRGVVAEAMTQARFQGANPDKCFKKQVASRMLYSKQNELAVKAHNREHPCARFSKVDLGGGAFIWTPTNEAGKQYLAELSQEERLEFLCHEQPHSPEPIPESRRVVDGRPVKAVPKGFRENEYFVQLDRHEPPVRHKGLDYRKGASESFKMKDGDMAKLRASISQASFGSV